MILRRLEDILGTPRDVRGPTFASRRLLLRDDGMGFSLHDTVIHAGTETLIGYAHHLEAVYCIEGEGEIQLLEQDVTYSLQPGTLYALDQHEQHLLRSKTGIRMVCVFSPPLTGAEVHDAQGAYPQASDKPAVA